jgi:hypothetical protein
LTVLLVIQCVAGLFAYGMDLVYPFSQARNTAQLIQQQTLADLRIVGDRDWAALGVSGYLDRPMYYPASDRVGSFVIWNNRRGNLPVADVVDRINRQLTLHNTDLLLVLNYPLTPEDAARFHHPPQQLARFSGAIVEDENFYLYRIRQSRS